MLTFLEYSSQVTFTKKQLKAFEAYVDRMFDKYDIDFDLTGKHFADRLNDERNTPKIDPKELASMIMKIYNNKGSKIKEMKGLEAVINDISSDLNMPVIVKYDAKNKEFDVIAKTIMRKKNFRTPDKKIKI